MTEAVTSTSAGALLHGALVQFAANPLGEWEVSDRVTHESLVDDAVFLAVQQPRYVVEDHPQHSRTYVAQLRASTAR